jgi:cysteine-rich repeat protein
MRTAAPRHLWRARILAPWLALAACFNPPGETGATTDEPATTTTLTGAATTTTGPAPTSSESSSESTTSSPTTGDPGPTADTLETTTSTTASETTTTDAVCGDGDPDKGEECDDGNLTDGDGCDSDCQYSLRIVFATKGQVNALMAHPATADALCDAEGKTVYPGHRFVAWTSAAQMPVVARLGPGTKPYYLPGGEDLVAIDLGELLSGALQRPISRDVHGNTLGPAPGVECTILTNEVTPMNFQARMTELARTFDAAPGAARSASPRSSRPTSCPAPPRPDAARLGPRLPHPLPLPPRPQRRGPDRAHHPAAEAHDDLDQERRVAALRRRRDGRPRRRPRAGARAHRPGPRAAPRRRRHREHEDGRRDRLRPAAPGRRATLLAAWYAEIEARAAATTGDRRPRPGRRARRDLRQPWFADELPQLARRDHDARALHTAAGLGDAAEVARLLAAGVPVDFRHPGFTGLPTPLIAASFRGHTAVVFALLAAGADVTATNIQQRTALHLAADQNHADVVALLCQSGAPLGAVDHVQHTALHVAAWQDHLASVRALLRAGAPLATRDINGDTALALAATEPVPEVIRALLAAGADLEAPNDHGQPPLMRAAMDGQTDNVALLLAAGADRTRRDRNRRTALDWARAEGHHRRRRPPHRPPPLTSQPPDHERHLARAPPPSSAARSTRTPRQPRTPDLDEAPRRRPRPAS